MAYGWISPGSPPHPWGQRPRHRQREVLQRFTPTRVGTTFPTAGRPRLASVHPHLRGDDPTPITSSSSKPVHPHLRGDDETPLPSHCPTCGSPPPAWGRQCQHGEHNHHERFTPTCVGTTWARDIHSRIAAVHPHLRGDNNGSACGPLCSCGSPPHPWGQRVGQARRDVQQRFTPTHVGTTRRALPACTVATVHPHPCGDDSQNASRSCSIIGSPPPTWGRLLHGLYDRIPHRFTPTRVGTTIRHACRARRYSVHPHPRGDDAYLMAHPDAGAGSPPPARGRPPESFDAASALRFTPTRVGTTVGAGPGAARASVHPHARGDDNRVLLAYYTGYGSPPHAWGRPRVVRAPDRAARFTPTRVGTTPTQVHPAMLTPVHPHLRGDDMRLLGPFDFLAGSPPPAWGRSLGHPRQ